MQRIHDIYRPAEERTRDWREVERMLSDEELKEQTSRCMNCGQPFCHAYGCPLGNLVPDQNRAVAQLGLSKTPRTALVPDPARNIYCVGDCTCGASLVVRALASGKSVALEESIAKPCRRKGLSM